MKKKIVFTLVLLIVLSNLVIFAGCGIFETQDELSIKESAILMSNDIMSNKMETDFTADINKELYDFTGKFNYLYCYNNKLDYYAIYNMDSGKIMERSNGNIYDGFLDYKCYYGGYSSYFYEIDNMLYDVLNEGSCKVDDAMTYFNEYSLNFMQDSIDESEFKSRLEIKSYVEKELNQSKNDLVITNCNVNNRGNGYGHLINDNLYSFIMICNSMYMGPLADSSYNICYVDGNDIGYNIFNRYERNSTIYDTLFPINTNGTCGLVAATMLLQYYERNQILNTIPAELYSQSEQVLKPKYSYDRAQILSENVHSALIRQHGGDGSGADFIEIKDDIKKYFKAYNITGISATSSLGYAGMKKALDNNDPCIIHVRGSVSIDVLSNDLVNYNNLKVDPSGHVMYTFGYTASKLGIIDEFICHGGWTRVDGVFSSVYVSKSAILGNVRLLY